MTHLDISEELAIEIAAERAGIAQGLEAEPELASVLRSTVEAVFPRGIGDAVAYHWTGTERGALITVIAALTVAIERGQVA